MPKTVTVALRKESVDRNNGRLRAVQNTKMSLSARRAWIEMPVDTSSINVSESGVALRKESVDRNFYYSDKDADWVRSLSARRAWIEIICTALKKYPVILSLSARRAWIEMDWASVITAMTSQSLSARRAWIEIHVRCLSPAGCWVALRKESVDRNTNSCPASLFDLCRSPQGERG